MSKNTNFRAALNLYEKAKKADYDVVLSVSKNYDVFLVEIYHSKVANNDIHISFTSFPKVDKLYTYGPFKELQNMPIRQSTYIPSGIYLPYKTCKYDMIKNTNGVFMPVTQNKWNFKENWGKAEGSLNTNIRITSNMLKELIPSWKKISELRFYRLIDHFKNNGLWVGMKTKEIDWKITLLNFEE